MQCLTVQLYEHQLQDAQWMLDQEMLDGGSRRHLWAEIPAHPLAPAVCVRWREKKHDRNLAVFAAVGLDLYGDERGMYR